MCEVGECAVVLRVIAAVCTLTHPLQLQLTALVWHGFWKQRLCHCALCRGLRSS